MQLGARCLIVGVATVIAALTALPEATFAQEPAPAAPSGGDIDQLVGRSATGLALPNVPIDAGLELKAGRAATWRSGATHMVLLEQDVQVAIGAYFFQADRAVIMATPRTLSGREVREVAIYFEKVRSIGGSRPRTPTAAAPRLLVTAVLRGPVTLRTDLRTQDPAESDELVIAARQRVQRYLDGIARNTTDLPQGAPLIDPSKLAVRDERRETIEAERAAEAAPVQPALPQEPAPSVETRAPVDRDASGTDDARVSFRADKVVAQKGPDGTEAHVLVMGDISLMFNEPGTQRITSLRAENAVIFLDPEALDDAAGRSLSAENVRGVYLEGNVIVTDGEFTFRGQRVFYDLKADRAVVLDAVLYAWDPRRQVPLYVRADHLRQHSANQWSAQDARFTTSEFAEPLFAIGVGKLTITKTDGQEAGADGAPPAFGGFQFDAQEVTLRASDVPFFYWPAMSGDATRMPLPSVNVGHSDRRGFLVETSWDLFALLNRTAPEGIEASLLVDGYSERGPAVGIESDYEVESAFGEFEAYYLHDSGEDEPGGREEVEPDTEHRGHLLWRHRHELVDDWEATVELAWLSDPNFLEEFYPSDAATEKEYESLIYLKQQRDDWAFTFLAKHDFLDFVPTTDLLQTRGNPAGGGYTTDKLPELEYYRIATPLWDNRLTWYSENRGSVMRLNLPRDTPRERGFTRAETAAMFGFLPSTASFSEFQEFLGFDEDARLRADTRQEIQAPLEIGIFNVTPYVVGRVTGYDDGFEDYAFAEGDDRLRLWGAVGAKVGTSFSQTYDNVESSLLDIHRLRHVIEPAVHLFYADTTMNQEELPVYDYDVESLSEGTQLRLGLRNTFQTQRGGEGNWRSVDWLRIDTDVIFNSDETSRESPIAQFFDYRPEHSLVGDHLWSEVAWQVTEAMAAVGNANYSLEEDEISRWSVGVLIDHTPRLTSFVQYREIEALDVEIPHFTPFFARLDRILDRSAYVRYGFEYLLTPKYHLGLAHSYDVERNQDRELELTITRRLPRWLVVVTLDFDRIEETTSAGVSLVPEGFSGRGSPGRNPFLFDRN